MKKIYPNFYDVVPMPMNGYILFKCPSCHHDFMYYAKEITKNKRKCPYCSKEYSLNEYYQNAYHEIYQYYHMIAIKNLLNLIDIKANIVENTTNGKLNYQIHFMKREQPNEDELKEMISSAFLELQRKVKENTIDFETKIHVHIKDLVNTKEYIKITMPCCEHPLMINKQYKDIKHCIYCQHDFT